MLLKTCQFREEKHCLGTFCFNRYQGIIKIRRLQVQLTHLGKLGKTPLRNGYLHIEI